MSNKYFQKALSDFTYNAASGGAIRHLTDVGYTVKQIMEELAFPTPYERVQKGVWERLIETGIILTKEPGSGPGDVKKITYIQDHDQFGKVSFRRVEEAQEEGDIICWKESHMGTGKSGFETLSALLGDERQKNGEASSYMTCDFGDTAQRDPERFRAMMQVLEGRQREYLVGLPWTKERIYHRLDMRMTEILLRLCETEEYRGDLFFMETGDKIIIG